ncbi:MAG TPA: tetratricopeptide repeat protein [Vicinamibacterales bacterium]|nr:tetratricopeptide repeat protein [Vicinamibacterales bacterium]
MKRVLAGLVLLGLSAAGGYGYTLSERERNFRQKITDGDSAVARDNSVAAIEAYSGAIALREDAMLGYLKRGQTYRRRGEFDAAIRDLRKASELDPTATLPLEELGDAYLGDTPHRYRSAAERFEAFVRLDSRAPRVLYKLAFARYHERHFTAAIEALQRALAIDDRLPEAHYLLGLCYRDAQQPDAARKALEKAIQLQPALLHAREELADLYRTLGRTNDHLTQLESLAALDPNPSRAVALGLAYARAGQTERAITTLGQTAERHPEDPYAYVALGRVWLEVAQGRNDRVALRKAFGALEGAVGNDDSSEALTLFGRVLLLTADEEKETAERVLLAATQRAPVDPLAFYYLAEAGERLGHFTLARQALLDYETLRGDTDPRRRSILAARLGDLSLKVNDPAAAAVYFFRAAENEDAALLARAADAQLRAGDRDAALATAAKVLEKDPANALAQSILRRHLPAKAGSRPQSKTDTDSR